VILEGYFDESGDLETDPGVFCVAGYFIPAESARQMERAWMSVLREHFLPYFHMVDCAHGNGVFDGMPVDERSQIVIDLIALIKRYTVEGVVMLAKADTFAPPKNDAPDPYSYLASACADALKMFLKMNRVEADVAYFFEQGHKNKGSAYNYIAEKAKRDGDSLTFAAKEEVCLLQAADLLAWQGTKYAKDYSYDRWGGAEPKRAPRRDFKSLMEHDHSFLYIGPEAKMSIEIWPMHKRMRDSSNIKIEDDGPITFWREDGIDLPIIPVDGAVGWTMGGPRMAYLAFRGMGGDRSFAVAFDEPRFFEAIGMFLEASGLFE
jgi:hypothetical protein